MNKLEEFLCNSGWNPESIGIVTKYLSNCNYEPEEYVLKLQEAFGYLSFAGLNSDQVEAYFVNNVRSLGWKKIDYLKLAAVFDYIDLADEIFKSNRAIARTSEYKKLFIRNYTLEKTGLLRNSYSVLVEGDKQAYSTKFYLKRAIELMFKNRINYDEFIEIESDESLENAYDILTNTENYIDKKIIRLSREFYEKYNKRKARLEGKMIDSETENEKQTGFGSI